MNHRLKMTLAVAALQLFVLFPGAGHAAVGDRRAAHGASAGSRASGGGRAPVSQTGRKAPRRKSAPEALTPGVWGGQHIRFEVTERGANIEYDCAHGTIEGRIVVDSRGRFSVRGMHYEEHAGPTRVGEEAGGYPVRLSGLVGGSLLKLTVTRAGTRRVVGTFTLARDREAEVFKCR